MRETGQRRIGVAAAVAMTVVAVGAAELGAFAPSAMAAPAHGAGTFSKAYQVTVGQKTSDVSLVVNEKAAGEVINLTASGAFNYASNQGHLTMNIGLGSAGTLALQEVVANGQAYIELPAAERSALGGKAWLAVPLGLNGSSGVGGESPTSALELLQASASDVTKVGPATIDGVPTTEYRANVDPSKATAKSSPQVRKMFQQAMSEFSGVNSLPIRVWIDSQDRIRQVTETLTLHPNAGSAAASAGTVHVATTVDLSNYGVPVSVTAPPPDQVSHQSLSQLGSGSGTTTS